MDTNLQQRIPIFASVPEWVRLTSMSRSETYRRLAAGNLRAIKVGAATRIDVTHGLAALRAQPEWKPTGGAIRAGGGTKPPPIGGHAEAA